MSVDALKKPNWFSRIAHPGQFLVWSRYLLWPLGIATVIAFAIGLWLSFFASPEDYQMGDMVRVMYIHVPNAWLSRCWFTCVMAACGAGHAGLAPSACRRRQQGGCTARRRIHRRNALYHRLALGPPDLGHLLGVGRPDDLRPWCYC